jgi:hypothetical protein
MQTGAENPGVLNCFHDAQAYYTGLSNYYAGLASNVQQELKWGDGMYLTCNSKTDTFYHVQISEETMAQINWYHLSNCNFFANWVIDVTGSGNVTIKGSGLPAIVERLIYNIPGTGRYISIIGSMDGNLLAPHNHFYMPGGVSRGFIVVGNVINSRQNNKPNCVRFDPVKIFTRITRPVLVGDTLIFVVDYGNIIIGDTICFNGNCQKVVAFLEGDFDGDGVTDYAFQTQNGATVDIPADSLINTEVDPQTPGDRNAPQTTSEFDDSFKTGINRNGAVQMVLSMVVMAVVAALF